MIVSLTDLFLINLPGAAEIDFLGYLRIFISFLIFKLLSSVDNFLETLLEDRFLVSSADLLLMFITPEEFFLTAKAMSAEPLSISTLKEGSDLELTERELSYLLLFKSREASDSFDLTSLIFSISILCFELLGLDCDGCLSLFVCVDFSSFLSSSGS